jgi:hypothetical protein
VVRFAELVPRQGQTSGSSAGPSAEVSWPATTLWYEVAPALALPRRFTYREEPADEGPVATLHMRVDEEGIVCERLEIEPRSADQPLSAQGLRRIRFGDMFQRAGVRAAKRITFRYPHGEDGGPSPERRRIRVARRVLPDGTRMVADSEAWLADDPDARPPRGRLADRWERMSAEALVEAVDAFEREPIRPDAFTDADRESVRAASGRPRRRRQLLTDEQLRAVVDDYVMFRELGQRDPTVQVAKKHHASRTTASRWIRRARDEGLLPPPSGRSG